MKAKIIAVHNQGDVSKEYVLIRVEEDCDIGRHMVADTTYTGTGEVSNKLRHIYWFPDQKVRKGDLVSLWTGIGNNETTTNNLGTPVHRFYWGLKAAVWNDAGDCAVLFELNTWQFFKARG